VGRWVPLLRILPCVSCDALAGRIATGFLSCGGIILQPACLGVSAALRQRKLRSKRSPTGRLPSRIRSRFRLSSPLTGALRESPGKRALGDSEDQSWCQQGP